jgi:hypothetical protein
MTDIIELIEKYAQEYIDSDVNGDYTKLLKLRKDIKSRISAMQDVCDAAYIMSDNWVDQEDRQQIEDGCDCPFCVFIRVLDKNIEVCK